MPPRKPLRLISDPYYGRGGLYFLTICAHHRRPYFANPNLANWIIEELHNSARIQNFLLHAWCIMPDHMHIFTEGASDTCDLRAFVTHFKQQTAFHFRRNHRSRLWHKNFYDHVIRPYEKIDPIFWYIWLNPVRKGLCTDPQDYPFSGSDTVDWKRKKPVTNPWVHRGSTKTQPSQGPQARACVRRARLHAGPAMM